MSTFRLSLVLGLGAGLADYLGGFLLVRRSPSAKALRYFVALGSGFMLSAAFLEMVPEGMAVNAHWAPTLILAGYCAVHLLEHTLVPHVHFGDPHVQLRRETHHHEFLSTKISYSDLPGLSTHTPSSTVSPLALASRSRTGWAGCSSSPSFCTRFSKASPLRA